MQSAVGLWEHRCEAFVLAYVIISRNKTEMEALPEYSLIEMALLALPQT